MEPETPVTPTVEAPAEAPVAPPTETEAAPATGEVEYEVVAGNAVWHGGQLCEVGDLILLRPDQAETHGANVKPAPAKPKKNGKSKP